jgi:hypothetical protein
MAAAAVAAADSHPSWWNLASPEATALVGIQWDRLRQSPFAEAVEAELSSAGSLGFPDLACLKDARQFLISSPAVLAIAAGSFPPATVHAQATRLGMKPATYRGVELWISPGSATRSVAQMSGQLLLIGTRKTLEDAVDRSLAQTLRRNSPLLARAARFSETRDLWVVATQLPDPLASLFVPLDAGAKGFEGGISVDRGLEAEAALRAASEDAAAEVAENLRQSIPSLPAVARTLQVSVEGDVVLLTLDVNQEQLEANLRHADAPPLVAVKPAVAPAPPIAAVLKPEPAQPSGPQIIRIFGLDEGTREIVLPPAVRQ